MARKLKIIEKDRKNREWTREGELKGRRLSSRRDVTARYSRTCMSVQGMSAFVRMNLGGTAEVKAPVLWLVVG